jgi:hypothetical protein
VLELLDTIGNSGPTYVALLVTRTSLGPIMYLGLTDPFPDMALVLGGWFN